MKRSAEEILESEPTHHKLQKQATNSDIADSVAIINDAEKSMKIACSEEDVSKLIAQEDILDTTGVEWIEVLKEKSEDTSSPALENLDEPKKSDTANVVAIERTNKEWKAFNKNVFYEWLKNFDERLLTRPNGSNVGYGWGGQSLQKSGWDKMFFSGRSRKYYNKYPEKEADDQALCKDICPLTVLHGLVKLFETRPNVCYGSYEMQIVCHPIKSRLLEFNRSIPEFLKRLLSLYDEAYLDFYARADDDDDEYRNTLIERMHEKTPKQLSILIAVFLTDNFSFLTKREIIPLSEDRVPLPEEKYYVYALMVEQMKDPQQFSEVVISNLVPGKNGWHYSLDNIKLLNTYLEKCLKEWRNYMYFNVPKVFRTKSMTAKSFQQEVITVNDYY